MQDQSTQHLQCLAGTRKGSGATTLAVSRRARPRENPTPHTSHPLALATHPVSRQDPSAHPDLTPRATSRHQSPRSPPLPLCKTKMGHTSDLSPTMTAPQSETSSTFPALPHIPSTSLTHASLHTSLIHPSHLPHSSHIPHASLTHPSHIPHTSLTHPSHIPHPSSLIPHTSHLTPHTSHLTPHP